MSNGFGVRCSGPRPGLLDWRQKLADARHERVQFVQAFEHLVDLGALNGLLITNPDREHGHPRDEFAEHFDEANVVRHEGQQLRVYVVHQRTLIGETEVVKREESS